MYLQLAQFICYFMKVYSRVELKVNSLTSNEGYFGGNQDNMQTLVETRTIQSDLNIDVLPPLIVVFLQFKICMWFPRHIIKDMVLLSTVVLGPFKNEPTR